MDLKLKDIQEMIDTYVVKDKGDYYVCRCPACNEIEAYAYKDNLNFINCSRQTNCGETTTISYESNEQAIFKSKSKENIDYKNIAKNQKLITSFFDYMIENADLSLNEYRGLSKDALNSIGLIKLVPTFDKFLQSKNLSCYEDFHKILQWNYYDLVIPIRNDNGTIERMIFRTTNDNEKYAKVIQKKLTENARSFIPYNIDAKTIYIVESPLDAASFVEVDKNVGFISSLSANVSKDLITFIEKNSVNFLDKNIVLAFDNDVAGEKANSKIEKVFNSFNIDCKRIDLKEFNDPNEALMKNKVEFANMLKNEEVSIKNDENIEHKFYHGSQELFENFSLEYQNKNGSAQGFGVYLTPNYDMAKMYTNISTEYGYLYEVSVNLEKEFSLEKRTISDKELSLVIDKLHETDDILNMINDVESIGYDEVKNEMMEVLKSNETDADLINELSNLTGNSENVAKALYDVGKYTHSIAADQLRQMDEVVTFLDAEKVRITKVHDLQYEEEQKYNNLELNYNNIELQDNLIKVKIDNKLLPINSNMHMPEYIKEKVNCEINEKEFASIKYRMKNDEAIDKMNTSLKDFSFENSITDFLDYSANFPKYSTRNTLILNSNKAKLVKSMNQWKKENVFIKKGSKAIYIYAPQTIKVFLDEDGVYRNVSSANAEQLEKIRNNELGSTNRTSYKLVPVFDISQTNIPIEKYPELLKDSTPKINVDNQKIISDLTKYLGINVIKENTQSAGGYIDINNKKIVINSMNTVDQNNATILHELGHLASEAQYSKLGFKPTAAQKEVHAEGIAYLVANHLNIDLSKRSTTYIASWSEKEVDSFSKNLDIIKKGANFLNNNIDKILQHKMELTRYYHNEIINEDIKPQSQNNEIRNVADIAPSLN